MTGWRIGWLVVPPALVRPIERLAQNLYISPPTIAQVAALGAFDGMDELEANRRVYAENRALLLDELPKLGLDRIVPADGAFYLYVDVGQFTADSLAFSKQMLAEIGIAATPGVDFDAERGNRFIRFCYAGTTAKMAEAVRRLRGWSASARKRAHADGIAMPPRSGGARIDATVAPIAPAVYDFALQARACAVHSNASVFHSHL